MIAAYLSVGAGIVVAIAYIVSVWRGLTNAKAEMIRHGGAQIGEIQETEDQIFFDQEVGSLYKSAAGVVLSTVALVLLILSPTLWYLVPFLSIGTAIAVIAAFIVEERSK